MVKKCAAKNALNVRMRLLEKMAVSHVRIVVGQLVVNMKTTLTDKQILDMLQSIIKVYDYDGYKSLFVNPEEPEVSQEIINNMILIVKKTLDK